MRGQGLGAQGAGMPSMVASGLTDLMTSLAVIFILLFAAYITRAHEAQSQMEDTPSDIRDTLADHFQRFGLQLEHDPQDPLVVRVIVPEELLNFEFGKSTLPPTAGRFLAEAMPAYATLACGTLRERIDSILIEGHTDDMGEDVLNLKLSQERSFNVMVKALEIIRDVQPWAYECFQEKTSASGRGRQDLIYEGAAAPNREKSRRVIFKIRLRGSGQSRLL